MTSTTAADTADRSALARAARPLLVLAFWLAVWQVAAVVVDQEILLVSPAGALTRLGELSVTAEFWGTVWHSFVRIAGGFLAASVVGVLGACLLYTSPSPRD